jgi:hypothetical protein
MDEIWLIWSNEHHAWWEPNKRGYTVNRSRAGRYTRESAELICQEANRHLGDEQEPMETMVRAK